MALAPTFMVNMSGNNVTVYSPQDWTTVVGYLYPREAFSRYGYEGGITSITFLGPNGSIIQGVLKNVATSVLTPCTNYPYATRTIGGVEYYVFTMRSTKGLFDKDGNQIGTVAAGKQVACKNAKAGQDYQWLKLVDKYQDSSGTWQTPDASGAGYGFVDTGLRTGSGHSNIAMYGSW